MLGTLVNEVPPQVGEAQNSVHVISRDRRCEGVLRLARSPAPLANFPIRARVAIKLCTPLYWALCHCSDPATWSTRPAWLAARTGVAGHPEKADATVKPASRRGTLSPQADVDQAFADLPARFVSYYLCASLGGDFHLLTGQCLASNWRVPPAHAS